MNNDNFKCPAVTTFLKDKTSGEKVSVTLGPYRNHLFNKGVKDKKDSRCMRCGVSR